MTAEYVAWWLGVFVFMLIGVIISIVFFRHDPGRINRHNDLDSALFEPNPRHSH